MITIHLVRGHAGIDDKAIMMLVLMLNYLS